MMLGLLCFKQETAYEVRISDWSSDVCSSDLIGVGADDVGLVHDRLGDVALEARQADHQLDVEAEALAVVAWADADLGRHGAVVRDLHLLLSGGDLNGAEKAGRIAGGEELLWIVALAARPAELLRGGKLDRSEEHTSELQSLMRIS